jgi:hypothetical protein
MASSDGVAVQTEESECPYTDIELSDSSSTLTETTTSDPLFPHKLRLLSHHSACQMIVIAVCLFGVALLVIFSTWGARHQHNYPNGCGNTPSEAKANNCRFDIMEIAWIPKHCFDETIMEAEDPFGHWKFYQDVHREWDLTEEVLRSGELPVFFADWTFHQAHCAYILKRLARGIGEGIKMPNRTVDMQHTMHCSGALVEEKRPTMVTMAIVNYLTCKE